MKSGYSTAKCTTLLLNLDVHVVCRGRGNSQKTQNNAQEILCKATKGPDTVAEEGLGAGQKEQQPSY